MNDLKHLRINNLSLSYGKTEVLHGISLEVEQGAIIALTGQSGCGKTSLLRCIAGLEQPSTGNITCNQRVLNDKGVFIEPELRNIGLIFQGNALFPHMTVQQNLMFGLRKLKKVERKTQAVKMLNSLGLDGLEKRYPHELSGGQQQRVAVGRSLITEPDVLLMDEPFSDLDKATKEDLRESIKGILKRSQITTIIVSHHADDVKSMAEQVYHMDNGKLLPL